MAKKRKSVPYIHNGVAHAGEDYESESTIDNPPRTFEAGFDEDGQAEIPGTEKGDDPSYESKYKFSLALTINAGFGAEKLIVVAGEAPAERIEEIMAKGLTAKRFVRKLRGVIGAPMFDPAKTSEIDGEPRSASGEGVEPDGDDNF